MFISVPAHLGYSILAALVAGESAGLPIPGETALISAALLAAAGHLSIVAVVAVGAVAASFGDNVGYWIGRRGGRGLVASERGPLGRHRRRLLVRGERFFGRFGSSAVVLGRFVPGVRVVIAMVAGASRMPVGTFMAANAAGSLVWAGSVAVAVWGLGPAGAGLVIAAGWLAAGAGAALAAVRLRVRRDSGDLAPRAVSG